MSYKKLQTNFERELLLSLIISLRSGKISSKKAKLIAGEFLTVLKNETTVEGFMSSLSKKAEFYTEIREAFLKAAAEYEKEMVDEKIGNVRNMLKGGVD